MFICETGGDIRAANAAAAELFGHEPGELSGMHIEGLRADGNAEIGLVETALAEETTGPVELIMQSKDGDPLICSVTFTADRDHLHVVCRDVTEDRRLERMIAGHLSEVMLVVDRDGRLTHVSPNAHVVFGYSASEIRAMETIDMLLPRDLVAQARRQLCFKAELSALECQIEDKRGQTVHLRLHVRRVPIGEGRLFVSCRDVTDLKESERALRESERKFRQLAEQSILGICLLQEGRFKYVNPRALEIFGYESGELAGKGLEDVSHPADWPRAEERLEQCLSNAVDGMIYQMRVRGNYGDIIYVELYGTRISSGGAPAILTYVLDVTDRRRLEEELLRVQDEERRHLGQELHDGVASQLTGIALVLTSYEDRLRDDESLTPEEIRTVKMWAKESETQLRQLSRGLHPTRFQKQTFGRALLELTRSLETRWQGNCTYDGPTEGPAIGEDTAGHLYRIAQEAATNAIQHGNAENIDIALSAGDDELILTITDDGEGFDPKNETSGLGLRSMRYRARMIGGTLEIRSSSTGTRIESRVAIT